MSPMLREKNNLVHNKTPDLGRAKTATPSSAFPQNRDSHDFGCSLAEFEMALTDIQFLYFAVKS
jgi:hypothetical protein